MRLSELNSLYLETDHLIIRPFEEADLEAIYSIHTNEEVNRYLPYETWSTWDDALTWYKRVLDRRQDNDAEQFVIVAKDNHQVMGSCIVFDFDRADDSCEFGYVLNRQYWGQGVMHEAAKCVVHALISECGFAAIRAVVQSENKASLQLLSKLNFKLMADIVEDGQGVWYLRLDS